MQLFSQILLVVLLLLFSIGEQFHYLDSSEVFDYMLLGIVCVIGYGNLSLHISQREVKKVLRAMSTTIIVAVLIRIVRMHLPDGYEDVQRFLWYCFYPCLFTMGYYSMKIVQILDVPLELRHEKIRKHWFRYIFMLDFLALMLIFTNDYHQLMFSFSPNFEHADKLYSGRIFEWPVKLYLIAQFVLPVALLIRDAIQFSYFRWKMLLPVMALAYAIVYQLGYSLGIPPFSPSENVLVTCFSICTVWYFAFTTDLIMLNDKYMEFFYASGLHNKIAAGRFRQYLFLKLEGIVAEEKNNIFTNIQKLKQGPEIEDRVSVLQHLRLSASLIKKQSLMFLQGEIYGYVPLADYQASIMEGWRFAREYNRFFSLNIELQGIGYKTDVALGTHVIIQQAFMLALKQDFDSLLVNIKGEGNRLEIVLMVDPEYLEEMKAFYDKYSQMIKHKGVYSFLLRPTEDAISLRLEFEEAAYGV